MPASEARHPHERRKAEKSVGVCLFREEGCALAFTHQWMSALTLEVSAAELLFGLTTSTSHSSAGAACPEQLVSYTEPLSHARECGEDT